jgi:hypothetical protein
VACCALELPDDRSDSRYRGGFHWYVVDMVAIAAACGHWPAALQNELPSIIEDDMRTRTGSQSSALSRPAEGENNWQVMNRGSRVS